VAKEAPKGESEMSSNLPSAAPSSLHSVDKSRR
jgi:hypothetical protein